jgi:DNA-damage-inducible protein D
MKLSEIEKIKNLKRGELLDRAGRAELAANLFRITQTEEKLINKKVENQKQANQIHNMVGGKVRQTIKNIGGKMPEKMLPEKHIKELKKDVKKITGKIQKQVTK